VQVFRKKIIVHGNIAPYEYQKHTKSYSEFLSWSADQSEYVFSFSLQTSLAANLSRQKNIARGSRSKFDLFTVVVLLDASLEVLHGEFHRFSIG
jgi:hypothetical protein